MNAESGIDGRQTPGALRILIVDDHAIVREGLQRLLERADPGWVVRQAGDGFQALEMLRRECADVAIIDLSMPGMSGLELLRRLRADFPAVVVVVLSMLAEEQYAIRAYRAGAHGYVTKDRAASELVAAVRKAAAGGAYVSARLAERMVLEMGGAAEAPAHGRLSDRELEVLNRIVAGQRVSEIALALHLSVKTVSTHKTRIMDKLQLTSMAALVRYGLEHGLGGAEVALSAPPVD